MSRVFSLRLDDRLADALDFQAAGYGQNVSELIRGFLVDQLLNDSWVVGVALCDYMIEKNKESYEKSEDDFYSDRVERWKNTRSGFDVLRRKALEKYPDYSEDLQLLYLKDFSDKKAV
ncbi:TPA: hypothetical protein ACU3BK_004615 [Salmonella enterica]|nr:hypothetical protein [Salmonella enterica]EKC9955767.1 hypothetical protein [Salmonella enterica]